MKILAGLQELSEEPLALLVGNFDGVHRGHQAVIRQLRPLAQAAGCRLAVLSFWPHPGLFLNNRGTLCLLQTMAEKAALLESHGVDLLINHPFNEHLATMEPIDFLDHLFSFGCIRLLSVGQSFRFGWQRKGDVGLLEALQMRHGFRLIPFEELSDDSGAIISSSGIRTMIREGRLAEAANWLGRPVFRTGLVVRGSGLGAQLGFPTANLACEHLCPLPHGVYSSWVRLDKRTHRSITHCGIRPTYGGGPLQVETHIPGVSLPLYGRKIALAFATFLRGEQRFSCQDALKEQISQDIAARLGLADQEPNLSFLDSLLEDPTC
jgi:riboflavin kinase/FMN adenylyltransferase